MNLSQVYVFYDSECPVCSREVELYKRLDKSKKIAWVNIQKQAKLAAEMGVNIDQALRLLHVKEEKGRLHIGLDGHIQMWLRLPYFSTLAKLLQKSPFLKTLVNHCYLLFTAIRPGQLKARFKKGASHASRK